MPLLQSQPFAACEVHDRPQSCDPSVSCSFCNSSVKVTTGSELCCTTNLLSSELFTVPSPASHRLPVCHGRSPPQTWWHGILHSASSPHSPVHSRLKREQDMAEGPGSPVLEAATTCMLAAPGSRHGAWHVGTPCTAPPGRTATACPSGMRKRSGSPHTGCRRALAELAPSHKVPSSFCGILCSACGGRQGSACPGADDASVVRTRCGPVTNGGTDTHNTRRSGCPVPGGTPPWAA